MTVDLDEDAYLNPYGWHLPITDAMLEESPYLPLDDPAQNIAERLVMLAHRSFNTKVWATSPDRIKAYWDGFGARIQGCANKADLVSWWFDLGEQMSLAPFRDALILHEKNLLLHPTKLPTTQVDDQDVLELLRGHYALDIRDRTRLWAKVRRDAREARIAEANDLDSVIPKGDDQ